MRNEENVEYIIRDKRSIRGHSKMTSSQKYQILDVPSLLVDLSTKKTQELINNTRPI